MLRVMLVVARGDPAGLRARVEAAPARVVGATARLTDALRTTADVIVIDGDVGPVVDEAGTAEDERIPILLASDDARAGVAAAGFGAAAWGVVSRDAPPADLAAALAALARGLVVLPPDLAARAVREAREDEPAVDGAAEALTPRERQVLELLAQGLHNREIAATLGVSAHTVKYHLASIFGKLGASTRTQAVRRGLRRGVIEI